MHKIGWLVVATAWFLTGSASAFGAERTLSHAQIVAIVEAVDASLIKNYVFPEKAKTIVSYLRAKADRGGYDSQATEDDFARALTDDLIKISGDLHFSVGVDPKWVAEYRQKDLPGNAAAKRQRDIEDGARTNFGFDGVSRLSGNVGYINLSYFADPTVAYDTASAAMRMVENSDAVIIDLRYNNGGYLEMAQFIASYFFAGDKDRLLFDYYYYEDGKRVDRGQWVLPALPGKRMVDKPVYILTGSTSFSSAEWFTYVMKKLGRAKIIGARTAGGAHPVDRKPIGDDFYLQVPIGQIRDPVDGQDFEGVGVLPDVDVPSVDALTSAHKLALEDLS
jgi:C-terminal processing protease CtpA/Prc